VKAQPRHYAMLTLVRHVICAPHSNPDKYYTAASQRPSVLTSDQHPSTLSITHPSDSLVPSYRIRSFSLANERASLGSRLIRQTHAQVSTRSTMMRTGTDAAERLEGARTREPQANLSEVTKVAVAINPLQTPSACSLRDRQQCSGFETHWSQW
jgi:hypothetical protein